VRTQNSLIDPNKTEQYRREGVFLMKGFTFLLLAASVLFLAYSVFGFLSGGFDRETSILAFKLSAAAIAFSGLMYIGVRRSM
jgi:hypothetical protein